MQGVCHRSSPCGKIYALKGAYDESRKIHLVRNYTALYNCCQGLLTSSLTLLSARFKMNFTCGIF
ncbi:hypothetical protein [Helicobacter sp.]|uniref:hypothetical protein n=1 Tax=Helicobacter sp. TaxID=218 RepID=UPI0019C15861|nr:hypothetical protein [Helicobacter sp.]MBD5164866.1 hypothetical protein [Helicobacter sp.]